MRAWAPPWAWRPGRGAPPTAPGTSPGPRLAPVTRRVTGPRAWSAATAEPWPRGTAQTLGASATSSSSCVSCRACSDVGRSRPHRGQGHTCVQAWTAAGSPPHPALGWKHNWTPVPGHSVPAGAWKAKKDTLRRKQPAYLGCE